LAQIRLEEIMAVIKKVDLFAIKVAANSIVGISGPLLAPVLSDQALELETNTESLE
jgi:hypothetical protein|tara:strand:+ start:229 stop:396 length:168 start_codon:yes stop_codon:yes gene_type:complete